MCVCVLHSFVPLVVSAPHLTYPFFPCCSQELEWKGQWNQAEHHYIAGGDWKGAVNMYRAHGLWDDAYRVSKSKGGQGAANQVAYLWAKSLGQSPYCV